MTSPKPGLPDSLPRLVREFVWGGATGVPGGQSVLARVSFAGFWGMISIFSGEPLAPAGRGSSPVAASLAACSRMVGTFVPGPLMAIAGVVSGSLFVLLDEPGVVHGT